MKRIKKNVKLFNPLILIIFLFLIGGFLRFYNLNWGSPYYFHPDERNMANAVSQMRWPNLNPHFFAYGQFPLFLAYFTGMLINILNTKYLILNTATSTVTFPQSILLLRFYAALSQILLLLVIYKISQKLFPKKTLYTICCILYTVFLPGLIQAAHFGTTESLLTLFLFITVYLSTKITDNSAKWYDYFFLILTLGFSLGTKLTALLYFLIPIFSFFLNFIFSNNLTMKQFNNRFSLFFQRILVALKLLTLIIFISFSSILISFFVSPYNIWQYPDFLGTINYETSVADGRLLVFYTRQFLNTQPFIFQFTKIFPYAVGPVLTILGTIGFFLMVFEIFKLLFTKKTLANKKLHTVYCILPAAFLIYFLPNGILFSKWTRFMAPIFPFFAIFSVYFLSKICPYFLSSFKNLKFAYLKFAYLFVICLFIYLSISPGLIFFIQVYSKEDIRLSASRWIYQNIPSGSHILSETGNVIDIPIIPHNYSITNYSITPVSFDFYHLDENPALLDRLTRELEKSNYIFIPSRRIFANHMRLPEKYPLTARYYELLFSGKLGFVKIKEFSRLNDENAEETWSVFDHPKIRIYKKIENFSKDYYLKLFKSNP